MPPSIFRTPDFSNQFSFPLEVQTSTIGTTTNRPSQRDVRVKDSSITVKWSKGGTTAGVHFRGDSRESAEEQSLCTIQLVFKLAVSKILRRNTN